MPMPSSSLRKMWILPVLRPSARLPQNHKLRSSSCWCSQRHPGRNRPRCEPASIWCCLPPGWMRRCSAACCDRSIIASGGRNHPPASTVPWHPNRKNAFITWPIRCRNWFGPPTPMALSIITTSVTASSLASDQIRCRKMCGSGRPHSTLMMLT